MLTGFLGGASGLKEGFGKVGEGEAIRNSQFWGIREKRREDKKKMVEDIC